MGKLLNSSAHRINFWTSTTRSTFMDTIFGCRIVESVGEGVMDIKKGDHVVPIFN